MVIGGLNPDFLAPEAPVPHLGTTDVDILFELGYVWDRDGSDFSWLAPALENAGFKALSEAGWQWRRADATSIIRIDLLCDVADSPDQPIALPGTTEVSAKNLAGPSGALASPITRQLNVDSAMQAKYPAAGSTVTLRFASLGGYLLAKSAALVGREIAKDAYDLMYVTLYNPGGPDGAGLAIKSALEQSNTHHDHRGDAFAAFRGFEARSYARWYAAQMIDSGDDSSEEQLESEAKLGASAVLRALG